MAKLKLNADEIRWMLDDAFHSYTIDGSLKKIEFTRREWSQYLKDNPEISAQYEQCLIDACPFLENDLLNIDKKFDGKQGSHKLAAIVSANIMKVLASRKPEKYGNKIDVNLNQTISIKDNLSKANERLKSVLREVGPAVLLPMIASKEE